MRYKSLSVLLALLLLSTATANAGEAKTVRVDCGKGQSINAALEDNADKLVIEIIGRCREQVTISRNGVTLRGSDPAVDGIVGPTGDPDAAALVQVWDVLDVRLENLQISGSEVRGVSFKNSAYTTPDRLSLLNCRVVDNAGDGGHFVDHSIIMVQDTTFARNLRGLTAHRDALVQCYNCTMEDNKEWPLRAYMSSRVYVVDSEVSGEGGVLAFLDASIEGQQSDVTAASQPALVAVQGGEISWEGGTVTGPLLVDTGALISLDDVKHNNPVKWISVSGSAALHALGTRLEGNATVDEFGELTLKGGSTLEGDLTAAYGGDAYCEDSGLVTGTANAEHCRNIPCTDPEADCIGVADLGFDPATQAELDAHSASPYAHHTPTLDTNCDGQPCDGTNFTNLDWHNLTNMPAGFADDVDHACTVVNNGDGTATMACPDGSSLTWRIGLMAQQITAGGSHSCALASEGSVVCWGKDDYGQLTPPAGTFTQVSGGGSHSCGVRTDGSAACWGNDAQHRSTPPTGTFAQISAGGSHSCGVKTDGSAACWGNDAQDQSTPPAGTFTQVSAGHDLTCGLRKDGSVVCWGGVLHEQSTPPPGTFTQVATGDFHSCGVKTGGSVVCWGADVANHDPLTPPAGSFIQVSAGEYHSCGLKRDGSVVCWGADTYDQSTPPPELQ
jgi:alpha-tubulin suppressor-like RCC1 family protein